MTPEEARVTDREQLAEVLAGHATVATGLGEWCCNCDPLTWRPITHRSRHLADAVLDYLAERDQRVKAETLREAASAPELRLRGHSGISVRGLLDRAERIERGEA